MTLVRAIPCAVDAEDAAAIASRAAGRRARARVQRRLFYPYYWSLVHHVAGATAVRLSCLVDARTGVSSTADAFEIREVETSRSEVLPPRLAAARCGALAERYAGFVLRNRGRSLLRRRIETARSSLVHKPFWIVSVSRDGSPFSVLVDGVNGGFHVLEPSGVS